MSRLSNLYTESVKKLRSSHFSKSCCVWVPSPYSLVVNAVRFCYSRPQFPKLTIDLFERLSIELEVNFNSAMLQHKQFVYS